MLISADEIKKRIKGYDPEKSEKHHSESARIADDDFKNALQTVQGCDVILMNGGSASGKTEFISEYLDSYLGIVFDGTLSTAEGARTKIKNMKKVLLQRKNLNNPQIKSYSMAVDKGMDNQHVVPHDGGWAVKKAGAARVSKVFDTQKEAVSYGQKVARNERSELFVHNSSGRIKTRKSF